MSPQFRKKPVVIEAMRLPVVGVGFREQFDAVFEWLHNCGCNFTAPQHDTRDAWRIFTLEGPMLARQGDWIIKGVKGEFYPCKPDIFEATYEPVATETDPEVTAAVPPQAGR